MTLPLMILAGCAVLVGLLFGPTHWFEHHVIKYTLGFENLKHPEHPHGFDLVTASVGTFVGLLGLGVSYLLYAKPSAQPGRLAQTLKPLYEASYAKFFVDEFYVWTVIRPLRGFASVCAFLDEWLLHGALVRGSAWMPRILGRELLAPLQNGLVQFYAAVTAFGVAGLLWILLLMK
jgi:NADH-quinone oxidoreductase subunit L